MRISVIISADLCHSLDFIRGVIAIMLRDEIKITKRSVIKQLKNEIHAKGFQVLMFPELLGDETFKWADEMDEKIDQIISKYKILK